ncbi:MAG: Rieske 2Fe-2S domain-containing protein, partial [Candidatus Micrarchaeaceae archaeon]
RKLEVPGHDEIVIANVDGKFYAMHGLCHHQGGPLAEGELDSNVITCPWHGAKWDVTTGKLVEFPIELEDEPVYSLTIEGDELFIEL